MIIKLTVNDNDYGELMNGFVRNLDNRISKIPSNIEELDINEQLEIIKELNMIDRLINPNITENHTDDEKAILVKRIKQAFEEYINKTYVCDNQDTANYLIKNFDVEIVNSMEDKWENGEVWYWFYHSRTYLCQ